MDSRLPVTVTALVATQNHAAQLQVTLAALLEQKTPADLGWEILVVDNGSTDGTRDVFRTLAMQAPSRLRYVWEPTPGKSWALNAGIAAARGAVLAVTDDDVSPAADWVATAAVVLDRWGADGAGGRILPLWEAEPPAWLLESPRLLDCLAIMEFDKAELLPVREGRHPRVLGANMVFRRVALQALGGFDTRLGPGGGKRYCEEDVDLVRRMLHTGRRIAYDPALTVFHRVAPARMRRAHFRRVMWAIGEGQALAAKSGAGPSIFGVTRRRYRHTARMLAHSALRAIARRPGAFDDALRGIVAAGTIWGCWKREARDRWGRDLVQQSTTAGASRSVRVPR